VVTHVAEPDAGVRAIKKRLVKYKRADGMDLSFTLYNAAGLQEGTRVPAVLLRLSLDYADPTKAGQVTARSRLHAFATLQILVARGIRDHRQRVVPIVGDPKRAYDTYLEQLVADAKPR